MKKVVVGMSGGVDSSAAALILKRQGYEVIGLTLLLYDKEYEKGGRICGTRAEIEDAKRVCETLGIRHEVLDYRERFSMEVIDQFVDSYLSGQTPNPCVVCNRFVKFRGLLEFADKVGAQKVATGHYANVVKKNDRYLLFRAENDSKDQSYALYGLTQRELSRVLFPLHDKTKDEVRSLAREAGLINAEKADSQDICFIPTGDYMDFITNRIDRQPEPGVFLNEAGEEIGRHDGAIRYTIGQRKGLRTGFGRRMYVTRKNMKENTVTLGGNCDLLSIGVEAGDVNLIPFDEISSPLSVTAQVRYRGKEIPATAFTKDGRLFVSLLSPVRAVTPGQAIVLYQGNLVIGGGTILKTIKLTSPEDK